MPIESPYMSELNKDVMQRVWMVFFVRRTLSSEAFKVVVFLSCCVTAVFMVSVPSIVQNVSQLSGGVAEGVGYLTGAFLNTSFIVEGAVVVAIAAGGLLVWDIGRNVRRSTFFVRGRSGV